MDRFQLERLRPFYPGQFGVPSSDALTGIRTGSGGVFYVGDTAATHYYAADVNDGTDPMAPKATITGALAACTNDYSDTIVLLSDNYVLTATNTIAIDRVQLISWDYWRGEAAPSVAITSATDDFTLLAINADQVEVAGIRFANGTDNANSCIVVGSTTAVVGCYIHDCKFAVGGGYGVDIGSAAGTVNDITVRHNTFIQIDNNAGAAGVRVNYAIRADVDDNLFLTDQAGTYCVSCPNRSSGGSVIRDNKFFVEEANGVAIFRAGNTVDAFMTGNRVGGGPTNITAITQRVDGGLYSVDNRCTSGAGGIIIDATT